MKTTKEIAADCGIQGRKADLLDNIWNKREWPDNDFQRELFQIIEGLYRRIEALEPSLENCIIMQSRVKAILDIEEAVEALCAHLQADDKALREAIKLAGGSLVISGGDEVPGMHVTNELCLCERFHGDGHNCQTCGGIKSETPPQRNALVKWWGYLHSNGTLRLKRWFGDDQDYTGDCEGNPCVRLVVEPFEAATSALYH